MQLPRFEVLSVPRLPMWVTRPLFLAPRGIQKVVLEKVLGTLLNEPRAEGETAFLEGRWCQIVVKDLGTSWFVSMDTHGPVVSEHGVQPDVTISGNAEEFILMASRREDPDTLFFQRRLVIEGDTELGLNVKNLIDSVDFDRLPKPLIKSLGLAAVVISGRRDAAC